MPIPESQLGRWSHHGAQDTAKNTHERIRRVLAAHQWPPGMSYDFYLQGSYRNDTNIRGDSDVDVVLEMLSTFIYDISDLNAFDQQAVLSTIYPPTYDWDDFRQVTIEALVAGFDAAAIEPRNKSIKVLAGSGRLAADVVVCLTHRSYVDRFNYREGITLYSVREGPGSSTTRNCTMQMALARAVAPMIDSSGRFECSRMRGTVFYRTVGSARI